MEAFPLLPLAAVMALSALLISPPSGDRAGGFLARRRGTAVGTMLPGAVLVGFLGLLASCVGQCPAREEKPRSGAEQAEARAGEYRATGDHSLLQPVRNRGGGATGGFGADLSSADFAYRLGTATEPVPEAQIEGLLAEHTEQIGLAGDHEAALRRVLGERPAFAAWKRFFADGGRVRPFTPVTPGDLAKTPLSQLALVGNGRYVSDRLVIVSRPDEPAMEEFLFHEIQHYILDKWDSAVFEAGDADHEVIGIVEERRRIVEAVRSGLIPMNPRLQRVLYDLDGAVTERLRAGRWAGAVERAQSESFYRGWVTATLQGALAKNENNRRTRMVSMELSDGTTLLFDERSDRESPDDVKAMNMRIPPHYRHGPVVYVSLQDFRRFDPDRLFSEGYVPEGDRRAVSEFVLAHRHNWWLGRAHVFSEPQLRDLAHLSAYNASIFQQALQLAESFREGTDDALEEVMKQDRYQAVFSEFLRRFADRIAEGPGADPRSAAAETAGVAVTE